MCKESVASTPWAKPLPSDALRENSNFVYYFLYIIKWEISPCVDAAVPRAGRGQVEVGDEDDAAVFIVWIGGGGGRSPPRVVVGEGEGGGRERRGGGGEGGAPAAVHHAGLDAEKKKRTNNWVKWRLNYWDLFLSSVKVYLFEFSVFLCKSCFCHNRFALPSFSRRHRKKKTFFAHSGKTLLRRFEEEEKGKEKKGFLGSRIKLSLPLLLLLLPRERDKRCYNFFCSPSSFFYHPPWVHLPFHINHSYSLSSPFFLSFFFWGGG